MADFDAPGATALNINNLPNELLSTIFRQVADQPDRVAAFYDVNSLRNTSRSFKELVETDPIIRTSFATLLRETEEDRIHNATTEARYSVGSRTANEIIAYHGVDDQFARDSIKWDAAQRDVNAGMVAPAAIERNGVDNQIQTQFIKSHGARRDIDAGMVAPAAIERNGVDNEFSGIMLKRWAAERDIDAGMAAPAAIERNGLDDQITKNYIERHAAQRANQRRFDPRGDRDRSRDRGVR